MGPRSVNTAAHHGGSHRAAEEHRGKQGRGAGERYQGLMPDRRRCAGRPGTHLDGGAYRTPHGERAGACYRALGVPGFAGSPAGSGASSAMRAQQCSAAAPNVTSGVRYGSSSARLWRYRRRQIAGYALRPVTGLGHAYPCRPGVLDQRRLWDRHLMPSRGMTRSGTTSCVEKSSRPVVIGFKLGTFPLRCSACY